MTTATTGDRFAPTLILASAGAGKTYALARRYLALAHAGAPVSSILASTFTRAAAGEIRDRILLRVAKAVADPAERTGLGADLGVPAWSRSNAVALLRTLATDVHRMQVRTLDSLFASVVRVHGLELGIPSDARIVDGADAMRLRSDAIHRLLADPRRVALVRTLRSLTQGTDDRAVTRTIDQTVEELYDLYRDTDAAAWDPIPRAAERSDAEVASLVATLEAIPIDDRRHDAARHVDADHARAGAWEAFVSSGLAARIANGERTYYKKPIGAEVEAAYRPLLDQARAVLVNGLRERTRAARELLDLFHGHYERAKREQRAMTFADLTAAMKLARASATFDDICYRLDGRLDHLLLDEFQDTNIPQWRVIEPIAREMLSDETRHRTFFCVGDVKQSIYGWRDACPEVLDEVPDLRRRPDGTSAIEQQTLARSYRSSPVIIDTVNEVFGSIADNPAVGAHPDAARRFAAAFTPHETAKDLPGYASLRTVGRGADHQAQVTRRIRDAAALVRELHGRGPHLTIGVLTRRNETVARLLHELATGETRVPATGRGGGPLTDSAAVGVVLSLLHLADHPGDTVAAYHVAGSPLGPVVGLAEHDGPAREWVAASVRRTLLAQGYGRVILGWASALAPACDVREHRRLRSLVELGGAWDERPTLRAGDFVRFVEQQDVPQVEPAPVSVMTIHQSKGMEFDVVVLPELQGDRGGDTVPVVFERDGATGPVTRLFRWVNEKTLPLVPAIQPMIDEHHTRTARESLCVLYVAVTRARQGLFMLIDPAKGPVRSGSRLAAADLLRAALAPTEDAAPERELWSCGAEAWIDDARSVPPAARREPAAPTAIRLRSATEAVTRVRGATPASRRAEAAAPVTAQLRLPAEDALDRGRAMHRLFEEVEWIETWREDAATLVRLVRRTLPRRDARWSRDVVDEFCAALGRPPVRAALARGDHPPGRVRVWRERRYVDLVREGGQVALDEGSIDRLVAVLDEHGRPRSARVVDFKTDRVTAADAPAAAERYRRQLDAYRAVAARLLEIGPEDVDAELVFVHAGVVVDLAGRGAGTTA